MLRIFALVITLINMVFLLSCASVVHTVGVITGDEDMQKAKSELGPSEQYYLGRAFCANILSRYELIEDKEVNKYINNVGYYLSLHTDPIPEKGSGPYKGYFFGVFKNKTPMAMSSPGGFILLSTGMMEMLDNEDQLALVLAHEMGHIMWEHGLLAIERKATSDAMKNLGVFVAKSYAQTDVDLGALAEVLGSSVGAIVDSSFSQDEEIAADRYGFEVAYKAGYAPKEMFKILAKLKALPSDGGFLSKHPSGSERVSKLRGISSKIKTPRKPASFRVSKYGQIKKRLQRL